MNLFTVRATNRAILPVLWRTPYLRFRRWTVRGVWDRIFAHLAAAGEPQLAFACNDGTITRAHQKAAGARPSQCRR
jgi:transposase